MSRMARRLGYDADDDAENRADAEIDRQIAAAERATSKTIRARAKARRIEAWLHRAEGLTLDAVGQRMGGLSKERVRGLLCQFARDARRAMQRTRWGVETDAGLRPVMSEVLEADRAARAAYEALGGDWDWATTKARDDWRTIAAWTVSADPGERRDAEGLIDKIEEEVRERDAKRAREAAA
jgi:hypothetical protein